MQLSSYVCRVSIKKIFPFVNYGNITRPKNDNSAFLLFYGLSSIIFITQKLYATAKNNNWIFEIRLEKYVDWEKQKQ